MHTTGQNLVIFEIHVYTSGVLQKTLSIELILISKTEFNTNVHENIESKTFGNVVPKI